LVECIWSKKSTCPFKEQPEDPRWCQACISLTSARTQTRLGFNMKMQFIALLVQIYGSEEKAKEIYNKIKEFAAKW
jgi:hypothetical protein